MRFLQELGRAVRLRACGWSIFFIGNGYKLQMSLPTHCTTSAGFPFSSPAFEESLTWIVVPSINRQHGYFA